MARQVWAPKQECRKHSLGTRLPCWSVLSTIARKMELGLVQAVAKSIVVDLAIIIEAKEAHQLPERLFGAVRLMRVSLDELS